ncbi:uncharacterized protein METZ01_LOCUS385993, partial [marine metagenome]
PPIRVNSTTCRLIPTNSTTATEIPISRTCASISCSECAATWSASTTRSTAVIGSSRKCT